MPIIEEVIGQKVIFNSGATDCNIPCSLGVPALCIGVNRHAGVQRDFVFYVNEVPTAW